MISETLDTTDWSILDFELAYDGIRQIAEASLWLQNQPRAHDGHQYHPGADCIVEIGESWCASVIDDLMATLREKRFDRAADEERRIRLLMRDMAFHGPAGEPLDAILDMVAEHLRAA